MNKNYYDILEVSSNASQAVIAAAYRTLSQRYHPDKNRGNESCADMMRTINVAFSVLSDPAKRKVYDDELFLFKLQINKKQDEISKIKQKPAQNSRPSHKTFIIYALVLFALIIFIFFVKLSSDKHNEEAIRNISRSMEEDELSKQMKFINADKLLTGDGHSQNYLGAMKEYKSISDSKIFRDGRAEQRIAEIYFFGLGHDKDYLKAMEWYKKANNFQSKYMIGLMYYEGLGIKKDLVMAYHYFNEVQPLIYESLTNKIPTNSLIQSKQEEYFDVKDYKADSLQTYTTNPFLRSAKVKKQLLDKQLTINEINQAQSLAISN